MDQHALQRLEFERVAALLARHALSGLGKARALRVRPATRFDLVKRWLTQVRELRDHAEQHGLPPLAGVTDVRETVERCAPPLRVRVEDMAQLRLTLAATREIRAYLDRLPPHAAELRRIGERAGDFSIIADRINRVVDERGEVRDDASPKLSRIREAQRSTRAEISTAADRLLRDPELRRLLQFPNHTFHNDRVVLPLKTEYRGRLQGIIHRTSDTGATIYIEPALIVELNNRMSELRISEQEEINRLLWELAREVHLNAAPILQTVEALGLLDLVTAKVRFAQSYKLELPELRDEPVLDVHEARHPLLIELFRRRTEQTGQLEQVVPIDYRIGLDFNVMILTGPNTGGKTIALKTMGLLCQMVQAGMPVPVAAGSVFGVFNNVLIDVGDEQSLQQSLSTFSAHLKRLLEMLVHAGPRTLVLIDELGAGTDPDEGAAIGAALLDELRHRGARVVATTHLGALKSYSLTREGVENASVDFDVQTMRPTYVLRIGEPGRSNAIAIAKHLGMPPRLVHESERNLSRHARQLRRALDDTSKVKRAAEEARTAAQQAQLAAQRAEAAAQKEREALRQQQADYRTWVQRVVHLRPGDAVRVRGFDRDGRVVRVRLDLHRAEVEVGTFSIEAPLGDILPAEAPPPPPKPERPKPVESQGPKLTSQPKPAPPQRARPSGPPRVASFTEAQLLALRPGDEVYVRQFGRNARVVRVNAEKRVVLVSMGLMQVETAFAGLSPAGQRPRRGDGHSAGGSNQGTSRNSKALGDNVVK